MNFRERRQKNACWFHPASLVRLKVALAIVFALLLISSPQAVAVKADARKSRTAIAPELTRFIAEKKKLAQAITTKNNLNIPAWVWEFFNACAIADWETAASSYSTIQTAVGRYGGQDLAQIWGAVQDAYGACEQFRALELDLLKKFGRDIIESIPPRSIYFGGTDAGRFVVSALARSHSEGKPFYALTQNQLVDSNYLVYLREMYGQEIQVPKTEDFQKAFERYLKDVQERAERKQLKDGETFSTKDGRPNASGTVAVMMVNELLVKEIMERNPNRSFYLEESYPMESLYSRCLPNGLVLKVEHEPLSHLPRDIVRQDHQFWIDYIKPLIGTAVTDTTSVGQLCDFAERVYFRSDLSGFLGNQMFLKDRQAQQIFSKCRSSIAVVYQSRIQDSRDDHDTMTAEADFAHRQAVALCPYSPEAISRYTEFLLTEKRTNDAKVLVRTTLKLNSKERWDAEAGSVTNSIAKIRQRAKELEVK